MEIKTSPDRIFLTIHMSILTKFWNQTEPTWTSAQFDKIFESHKSLVQSVATKICGNSNSDDLVQEIFLQIWRKQKSFRQQSSLQTWIYRIAVNHSIDHYRRSIRSLAHLNEYNAEESVHDSNNEDLDSEYGKTNSEYDNQRLVRESLDKLSVDQRAVAVLFYFEEKSTKEISEILEIPIGTIKSRLFHARKSLTDSLRKKGVKL